MKKIQMGMLSVLMLTTLSGCQNAASQSGEFTDKLIMCLLLLVVGIPNVVAPKTFWELTRAISFNKKGPSDFALKVNRVVGALISLAGVAYLFL